ncbi:hypothetical protein SAMN03097699_0035 [Flavobacteriaceae bacterium MAR_2010_188]|nr:hypothetical protein SAMN03097699_0035 [Flavobacteriaceae bacterium MAR_2010_188]
MIKTDPNDPNDPNAYKRQHMHNKHTDDLIDHYWASIEYVSKLIQSSELKAGLILSIYGIMLNFIYQNIPMVVDKVTHDTFFYILLFIWFVITVCSMYFSIRCFMPRIEGKYEKNIFFFGDIVSKFGDIKEFSRTFYNISIEEEKLFDQLGQQIYINSKIASLKFKYVNKSLKLLALGLILLLVIVIYYIVMTL